MQIFESKVPQASDEPLKTDRPWVDGFWKLLSQFPEIPSDRVADAVRLRRYRGLPGRAVPAEAATVPNREAREP